MRRPAHLVETFGKKGIVDLKQDDDQDLDLIRSVVGLNATPLVAGNVIVVGAAHAAMGSQTATTSAIGYVRGFDVKTGKRLWIFHTIPKKGEFGYDTWLDGSAERNGNTGRVGADERRHGVGSRLCADRNAGGTIITASTGPAIICLRKAWWLWT